MRKKDMSRNEENEESDREVGRERERVLGHTLALHVCMEKEKSATSPSIYLSIVNLSISLSAEELQTQEEKKTGVVTSCRKRRVLSPSPRLLLLLIERCHSTLNDAARTEEKDLYKHRYYLLSIYLPVYLSM